MPLFYWLARMIESGEDPLYLARRMVRMASEDIGLAEARASPSPSRERRVRFPRRARSHLALAQAAVLSLARAKIQCCFTPPTARSSMTSQNRGRACAFHIRNAVTGLMKNIGYGQGYKYAHNFG